MSLGHGSSIAKGGLVLQLDAANTKSYPSSGASWYDISGSNYVSTLFGSPTYTTQPANLSFNGSTQYATITSAGPSVAATASVTQEAVVYTSTRTGTLFCRGRSGISFNYGMVLGTSLYFRNTNSDYSVTPNLLANTWYHLAIVTNNSGSTGYINGIKQNTVAYTTTTNSIDEICIARRSTNSATEYFNGNIAVIRVYHRLLSDAEILQNFEALRGRYGI